jgi:GNAT superfamily N-acetyltransferase
LPAAEARRKSPDEPAKANVGRETKETAFTVYPLTVDRWAAFEDLFGRHGASNGCWCMYWRIGSAYHKRPREENRTELRRIVRRGPPPGLLAFSDETPVGWCQLTPRRDLLWLDATRVLRPVDEIPVWSISCFYVRRGYRRRGVASALIAAALKAARRAKAPALEAYPVDTGQPGSTSNTFTGTVAMFERAGFQEVDRRSSSRPIMRYVFSRKARAGF